MSAALLGDAMLIAFAACCVASGVVQVIAWSRHSLRGAPVSVRALWRPEGHFDATGLRLIRLARRLLMLGGVAYIGYGALIIFMNTTGQ